jgi:hypothetical protein
MELITKNRWMNGGKPERCARCKEKFDGEAHHGQFGYYCSAECKQWAEGTVEDRARKLQ